MTGSRPTVTFLDVNETLSDLAPLRAAFTDAGLAGHEVEAWFAGVLRDGFASTLAGGRPAFADLATTALEIRIAAAGDGRVRDPRAAAQDVMSAFTRLRPHPDVVPGLLGLAGVGCRLVTLSVGSADVARALLAGTAAAPVVDAYLSAADAPRWKPAPEAYRWALDQAGVEAADAMLVAVHPWDLSGAANAGLRTAWINRSGAEYPGYFPAPDVEAASLEELAGVLA